MREVNVAKTAGFCFGVQRAVERVYKAVEENQKNIPIYTYGPIIHNEEVVRDLEARHVKVISSPGELDGLEKGIVVIRSHGVSRAVYEELQEKSLEVIDVTCPFVKKIHRIVEEQSRSGRKIVIVGNPSHPEVEGIVGWCHTEPVIIEKFEDFDKNRLTNGEKLCIVAQTTFHYGKFKDLVEKLEKMGYDINVLNTICNATQERQTEARSLAAQSDGMLVIGGKNSSNTQKLFEICRQECPHTYFIQTAADLQPGWFPAGARVGITAGASTPHNIIEEVQTHVRNEL